MTGEELLWDIAEPLFADPAVSRSTMMGFPCLRYAGRYVAAVDRKTGALVVKLPSARVGELVAQGTGDPFAPAGRVFREWVATSPERAAHWPRLLAEALTFAGAPDRSTSALTATPADSGFAGFGADGPRFLAELEHDNSTAFFAAHRQRYEHDLLAPSKQFVVALGGELHRRVSAGIHAEPRIGASLFRINNDLRFQPDRPPYRTWVDFLFWEGDGPARSCPALMLRITPDVVHLGAGVARLSGDRLARYRKALADPVRGAELVEIVDTLETGSGAALGEPHRKRPPAGLVVAGPVGRFAVRDGFHLMREVPLPASVTTPGSWPGAPMNWPRSARCIAGSFTPCVPARFELDPARTWGGSGR